MSAANQRLCHITKWDHFDGYGFDLHAEKGKPGQYIGKVDDASPAEAAGLRQGDRIIEVNGAPIEGKTHREVVDLIKTVPNETKLLVVSDSKSPCNSKKIDIDTQIKNGTKNGNTQNGNTNTQLTNNNINGENKIEQTITNGDQHSHEITERPENTTKTASTNGSLGTASDSAPATPMGGATGGATGLNLNMTAAELRARLAAKKKFDPKKESSMDFKKKFDMIQKL